VRIILPETPAPAGSAPSNGERRPGG
jgi:hypothetical protein